MGFRGALFSTPRGGRASGWIALALVIGLWQLAGSAGWVNPLFLPAPRRLRSRSTSSRCQALWHHLSYSIMRIATLAGSWHSRQCDHRLRDRLLHAGARGVGITFISALFPILKIALLPLILWLGIGEEPKIATIALGAFFSTAISVYSGVDAVPRNLIRMAQSFNVPFHAIVRR